MIAETQLQQQVQSYDVEHCDYLSQLRETDNVESSLLHSLNDVETVRSVSGNVVSFEEAKGPSNTAECSRGLPKGRGGEKGRTAQNNRARLNIVRA